MKCVSGPSSIPVIPTVMAKSPQLSGASASGERVSYSDTYFQLTEKSTRTFHD